jgi:hypothetical protein
MSRAGYSDDYDSDWAMICWRGAVASAIRGARGQAFLRELIAALDAMPERRLIAHELAADGAFCAIGSVGAARGVDMAPIDPEDHDKVARVFGISAALVREIEWLNDEAAPSTETPEQRWQRMRDWASANLIEWERTP